MEIDDQRYSRDSLLITYEENDYSEQHKFLKLFCKEYIGESLLNPFIIYQDMETKYTIGILDLRHQSDHITPKIFNYFKKMALILIMLDFIEY